MLALGPFTVNPARGGGWIGVVDEEGDLGAGSLLWVRCAPGG